MTAAVPAHCQIEFTILKGTDHIQRDGFGTGTNDPYICFMDLHNETKEVKRSIVIDDELSPDWDKELKKRGGISSDKGRKFHEARIYSLDIKSTDDAARDFVMLVYDEDTIGSDFLGEVRVNLKSVILDVVQGATGARVYEDLPNGTVVQSGDPRAGRKEVTLPLRPRPNESDKFVVENRAKLGTLTFCWKFTMLETRKKAVAPPPPASVKPTVQQPPQQQPSSSNYQNDQMGRSNNVSAPYSPLKNNNTNNNQQSSQPAFDNRSAGNYGSINNNNNNNSAPPTSAPPQSSQMSSSNNNFSSSSRSNAPPPPPNTHTGPYNFTPSKSQIEFTILKGTDHIQRDGFGTGTNDPYICFMDLHNETKEVKRSIVIDDDLNPDWDKEVQKRGGISSDKGRKFHEARIYSLEVATQEDAARDFVMLVYDEDTVGSDFLGEVRVNLKSTIFDAVQASSGARSYEDLPPGTVINSGDPRTGRKELTLPLRPRPNESDKFVVENRAKLGTLTFSWKWTLLDPRKRIEPIPTTQTVPLASSSSMNPPTHQQNNPHPSTAYPNPSAASSSPSRGNYPPSSSSHHHQQGSPVESFGPDSIPAHCQLEVTILKGTDHIQRDGFGTGTNDPYICFMDLHNETKEVKRSIVIDDELSPDWEKELQKRGGISSDKGRKFHEARIYSLDIKSTDDAARDFVMLVYDEDTVGSDFLGEVRANVKSVFLNVVEGATGARTYQDLPAGTVIHSGDPRTGPKEVTLPLQPRPNESDKFVVENRAKLGTLTFCWKFTMVEPRRRAPQNNNNNANINKNNGGPSGSFKSGPLSPQRTLADCGGGTTAGSLEIVVHRGSNHIQRDGFGTGTNDPYICFMDLHDETKELKQSVVIDDDLNPDWDKEVQKLGGMSSKEGKAFDEARRYDYMIENSVEARKDVVLLVYDKDLVGSDFLGEVRLNIKKMVLDEVEFVTGYDDYEDVPIGTVVQSGDCKKTGGKRELVLPLRPRPNESDSFIVKHSHELGDLTITWKWTTRAPTVAEAPPEEEYMGKNAVEDKVAENMKHISAQAITDAEIEQFMIDNRGTKLPSKWTIFIRRGESLADMDGFGSGLSDPYVKVFVDSGNSGGGSQSDRQELFRTPVLDDTLDPVWPVAKSSFTIKLSDNRTATGEHPAVAREKKMLRMKQVLDEQFLTFEVMDQDTVSDDMIGACTLSLRHMLQRYLYHRRQLGQNPAAYQNDTVAFPFKIVAEPHYTKAFLKKEIPLSKRANVEGGGACPANGKGAGEGLTQKAGILHLWMKVEEMSESETNAALSGTVQGKLPDKFPTAITRSSVMTGPRGQPIRSLKRPMRPAPGELKLTIVRAVALPNVDIGPFSGLTDSYVRVVDPKGQQVLQTPVVKDNLNPDYPSTGSTCTIKVVASTGDFRFSVMDEGTIKDSEFGVVRVPVVEMLAHEDGIIALPICSSSEAEKDDAHIKKAGGNYTASMILADEQLNNDLVAQKKQHHFRSVFSPFRDCRGDLEASKNGYLIIRYEYTPSPEAIARANQVQRIIYRNPGVVRLQVLTAQGLAMRDVGMFSSSKSQEPYVKIYGPAPTFGTGELNKYASRNGDVEEESAYYKLYGCSTIEETQQELAARGLLALQTPVGKQREVALAAKDGDSAQQQQYWWPMKTGVAMMYFNWSGEMELMEPEPCVRIHIYERDLVGSDDFLGEAIITVSELLSRTDDSTITVALQPRDGESDKELLSMKDKLGTVTLHFRFFDSLQPHGPRTCHRQKRDIVEGDVNALTHAASSANHQLRMEGSSNQASADGVMLRAATSIAIPTRTQDEEDHLPRFVTSPGFLRVQITKCDDVRGMDETSIFARTNGRGGSCDPLAMVLYGSASDPKKTTIFNTKKEISNTRYPLWGATAGTAHVTLTHSVHDPIVLRIDDNDMVSNDFCGLAYLIPSELRGAAGQQILPLLDEKGHMDDPKGKLVKEKGPRGFITVMWMYETDLGDGITDEAANLEAPALAEAVPSDLSSSDADDYGVVNNADNKWNKPNSKYHNIGGARGEFVQNGRGGGGNRWFGGPGMRRRRPTIFNAIPDPYMPGGKRVVIRGLKVCGLFDTSLQLPQDVVDGMHNKYNGGGDSMTIHQAVNKQASLNGGRIRLSRLIAARLQRVLSPNSNIHRSHSNPNHNHQYNNNSRGTPSTLLLHQGPAGQDDNGDDNVADVAHYASSVFISLTLCEGYSPNQYASNVVGGEYDEEQYHNPHPAPPQGGGVDSSNVFIHRIFLSPCTRLEDSGTADFRHVSVASSTSSTTTSTTNMNGPVVRHPIVPGNCDNCGGVMSTAACGGASRVTYTNTGSSASQSTTSISALEQEFNAVLRSHNLSADTPIPGAMFDLTPKAGQQLVLRVHSTDACKEWMTACRENPSILERLQNNTNNSHILYHHQQQQQQPVLTDHQTLFQDPCVLAESVIDWEYSGQQNQQPQPHHQSYDQQQQSHPQQHQQQRSNRRHRQGDVEPTFNTEEERIYANIQRRNSPIQQRQSGADWEQQQQGGGYAAPQQQPVYGTPTRLNNSNYPHNKLHHHHNQEEGSSSPPSPYGPQQYQQHQEQQQSSSSAARKKRSKRHAAVDDVDHSGLNEERPSMYSSPSNQHHSNNTSGGRVRYDESNLRTTTASGRGSPHRHNNNNTYGPNINNDYNSNDRNNNNYGNNNNNGDGNQQPQYQQQYSQQHHHEEEGDQQAPLVVDGSRYPGGHVEVIELHRHMQDPFLSSVLQEDWEDEEESRHQHVSTGVNQYQQQQQQQQQYQQYDDHYSNNNNNNNNRPRGGYNNNINSRSQIQARQAVAALRDRRNLRRFHNIINATLHGLLLTSSPKIPIQELRCEIREGKSFLGIPRSERYRIQVHVTLEGVTPAEALRRPQHQQHQDHHQLSSHFVTRWAPTLSQGTSSTSVFFGSVNSVPLYPTPQGGNRPPRMRIEVVGTPTHMDEFEARSMGSHNHNNNNGTTFVGDDDLHNNNISGHNNSSTTYGYNGNNTNSSGMMSRPAVGQQQRSSQYQGTSGLPTRRVIVDDGEGGSAYCDAPIVGVSYIDLTPEEVSQSSTNSSGRWITMFGSDRPGAPSMGLVYVAWRVVPSAVFADNHTEEPLSTSDAPSSQNQQYNSYPTSNGGYHTTTAVSTTRMLHTVLGDGGAINKTPTTTSAYCFQESSVVEDNASSSSMYNLHIQSGSISLDANITSSSSVRPIKGASLGSEASAGILAAATGQVNAQDCVFHFMVSSSSSSFSSQSNNGGSDRTIIGYTQPCRMVPNGGSSSILASILAGETITLAHLASSPESGSIINIANVELWCEMAHDNNNGNVVDTSNTSGGQQHHRGVRQMIASGEIVPAALASEAAINSNTSSNNASPLSNTATIKLRFTAAACRRIGTYFREGLGITGEAMAAENRIGDVRSAVLSSFGYPANTSAGGARRNNNNNKNSRSGASFDNDDDYQGQHPHNSQFADSMASAFVCNVVVGVSKMTSAPFLRIDYNNTTTLSSSSIPRGLKGNNNNVGRPLVIRIEHLNALIMNPATRGGGGGNNSKRRVCCGVIATATPAAGSSSSSKNKKAGGGGSASSPSLPSNVKEVAAVPIVATLPCIPSTNNTTVRDLERMSTGERVSYQENLLFTNFVPQNGPSSVPFTFQLVDLFSETSDQLIAPCSGSIQICPGDGAVGSARILLLPNGGGSSAAAVSSANLLPHSTSDLQNRSQSRNGLGQEVGNSSSSASYSTRAGLNRQPLRVGPAGQITASAYNRHNNKNTGYIDGSTSGNYNNTSSTSRSRFTNVVNNNDQEHQQQQQEPTLQVPSIVAMLDVSWFWLDGMEDPRASNFSMNSSDFVSNNSASAGDCISVVGIEVRESNINNHPQQQQHQRRSGRNHQQQVYHSSLNGYQSHPDQQQHQHAMDNVQSCSVAVVAGDSPSDVKTPQSFTPMPLSCKYGTDAILNTVTSRNNNNGGIPVCTCPGGQTMSDDQQHFVAGSNGMTSRSPTNTLIPYPTIFVGERSVHTAAPSIATLNSSSPSGGSNYATASLPSIASANTLSGAKVSLTVLGSIGDGDNDGMMNSSGGSEEIVLAAGDAMTGQLLSLANQTRLYPRSQQLRSTGVVKSHIYNNREVHKVVVYGRDQVEKGFVEVAAWRLDTPSETTKAANPYYHLMQELLSRREKERAGFIIASLGDLASSTSGSVPVVIAGPLGRPFGTRMGPNETFSQIQRYLENHFGIPAELQMLVLADSQSDPEYRDNTYVADGSDVIQFSQTPKYVQNFVKQQARNNNGSRPSYAIGNKKITGPAAGGAAIGARSGGGVVTLRLKCADPSKYFILCHCALGPDESFRSMFPVCVDNDTSVRMLKKLIAIRLLNPCGAGDSGHLPLTNNNFNGNGQHQDGQQYLQYDDGGDDDINGLSPIRVHRQPNAPSPGRLRANNNQQHDYFEDQLTEELALFSASSFTALTEEEAFLPAYDIIHGTHISVRNSTDVLGSSKFQNNKKRDMWGMPATTSNQHQFQQQQQHPSQQHMMTTSPQGAAMSEVFRRQALFSELISSSPRDVGHVDSTSSAPPNYGQPLGGAYDLQDQHQQHPYPSSSASSFAAPTQQNRISVRVRLPGQQDLSIQVSGFEPLGNLQNVLAASLDPRIEHTITLDQRVVSHLQAKSLFDLGAVEGSLVEYRSSTAADMQALSILPTRQHNSSFVTGRHQQLSHSTNPFGNGGDASVAVDVEDEFGTVQKVNLDRTDTVASLRGYARTSRRKLMRSHLAGGSDHQQLLPQSFINDQSTSSSPNNRSSVASRSSRLPAHSNNNNTSTRRPRSAVAANNNNNNNSASSRSFQLAHPEDDDDILESNRYIFLNGRLIENEMVSVEEALLESQAGGGAAAVFGSHFEIRPAKSANVASVATRRKEEELRHKRAARDLQRQIEDMKMKLDASSASIEVSERKLLEQLQRREGELHEERQQRNAALDRVAELEQALDRQQTLTRKLAPISGDGGVVSNNSSHNTSSSFVHPSLTSSPPLPLSSSICASGVAYPRYYYGTTQQQHLMNASSGASSSATTGYPTGAHPQLLSRSLPITHNSGGGSPASTTRYTRRNLSSTYSGGGGDNSTSAPRLVSGGSGGGGGHFDASTTSTGHHYPTSRY